MNFFTEAEAESKRLIEDDPDYFDKLDAVFLGLIGFEFEQDKYTIQSEDGKLIAYIRRVDNPPGEVALARSLRQNTLFGAVGRYSRHVTFEMAVPRVDDPDVQATIDAAFQLSACLRINGAAEGVIPVALDRSWSVVSGISDNSCDAYMFEDFPKAKSYRRSPPIDDGVVRDVGKYLDSFSKLYEENASYRTAVNSYCSYCHNHDPRLTAASLWAGIEALFNVEAELRFRLSLYISVVTEDEGEKRYEKFKKAKALYDTRSKIIHGRKIPDADIANHIIEVSLLLGYILHVYMINGVVLETNQIEEILLHPENQDFARFLLNKHFELEERVMGKE